jgi:hypothetical protein
MTKQTPKPSPGAAWGSTVAAALDLFAFVLLGHGNTSPLLLAFFGLCEVVLILCAAVAWKTYFENFVSYKLSEKSVGEQSGAGQPTNRAESE